MKLITIAVIALVGFYSAQAAQAAPPEKKGDTDATLAIVVEKTSKLKESVDKAKTSLGKATQTSAETLAQFDQAIATAKLVLDKMGENGEVAKLIDDAIKKNEGTIKKIEDMQRTSPEKQAKLESSKQKLSLGLDRLFSYKTQMIKTQFDTIKKLKNFEEGKEIFSMMEEANNLDEANKDLSDVIKGMTELGTSLDGFKSVNDKAGDDTRPSKN